MKVILWLSLGLAALAQTSELEQTKPPVISADVRAAFWRAALEKTQAESKFNEITTTMRMLCGPTHTLSQDGSGEPKCVVKPVIPTSTPNTKVK